jgi:hypothetical protein
LDKDQGGTINAEEFGSALARVGIGLDAEGLGSLFALIDVNQDGGIGMDEWTLIMRGLERKMFRRCGTRDDVCRAINSILRAEQQFRWQKLAPGFANIGLVIAKKLPGKHPQEMITPIRDMINSQRRRARYSSEVASTPELPLDTEMEEVGTLEFGHALHELLCKDPDDLKCDLHWSVTRSEILPKDFIVDLWRQAVRRFLWLELLHETIAEHQTMHGTKNNTSTEEELRSEIETRCFFFAPDHPFVAYWDLFQVLVLFLLSIILPLRAGFDQIDQNSPRFWFVADLVTDLYFYFDIVLNFRTAFFDHDHVLQSAPRTVARNYLTGWFLADFVSCAPVSYVVYVIDPSMLPWRAAKAGDAQSGAGSLKILKLLRLSRLSRMMRMLKLKSVIDKYEDHKVHVWPPCAAYACTDWLC